MSKLRINLDSLEVSHLLTFLALLSVSYMFIYKFTLMKMLNINWYMGILSPQQLILSSIQNLLLLIASSIVAICCFKLISRKTFEMTGLLFVGLCIVLMSIMLCINKSYMQDLGTLNQLYLLHTTGNILYITAIMVYIKYRNELHQNLGIEQNKLIDSIVLGTLTLCVIVFLPWNQARSEHYLIKNSTDEHLPRIIIKEANNQEKWYLLEAGTENILVVREPNNERLELKILKVDEIEKIILPTTNK